MRSTPKFAMATGLGAFALFFALGFGWNVVSFRAHDASENDLTGEPTLIPRPDVATRMSLGFQDVLADLYWAAAIHYYAEPRNETTEYSDLPKYVNLIIALAPDWEVPYRFGGIGIPFLGPDGKYVHVQEAEEVLRHGIARFPQNWFLGLLLSYNLSQYQARYGEAGDVLAKAARIPGAPSWYTSLALRMKASANDMNGAILLAHEFEESSEDPAVKLAMEQRIDEFEVLNDVKMLQRLVDQFRAQQHRPPESLEELKTAGLLKEIPTEKLGGAYIIDAKTGKVESTTLQGRTLGVYSPRDAR